MLLEDVSIKVWLPEEETWEEKWENAEDTEDTDPEDFTFSEEDSPGLLIWKDLEPDIPVLKLIWRNTPDVSDIKCSELDTSTENTGRTDYKDLELECNVCVPET